MFDLASPPGRRCLLVLAIVPPACLDRSVCPEIPTEAGSVSDAAHSSGAAATTADPDLDPEDPTAAESGGMMPPPARCPESDPHALFDERTFDALPVSTQTNRTMEARAADFDGDGDLDLLLAKEWAPNVLLLNALVPTGTLEFVDASDRIPQVMHDSEDIAIGDFDGDGDIDALVVSEDDQIDELYRNVGNDSGGPRFENEGLPVQGRSNAVATADLDEDGWLDIVIGNDGVNTLLINDGRGGFVDETASRLPPQSDVTQDVVLGDLDGDGDLDLVIGNEGPNRIWRNEGRGVFVDVPDALAPTATNEETRNVDLADVDGDGDLDLFFANVAWVPGSDPRDRLLLNDGTGGFTADEAPPWTPTFTLDGDFVDVDLDGDPDLVTSSVPFAPYRVWLNEGGAFTDATDTVFPAGIWGEGVEVEAADLSGDGVVDLYFGAFADGDRLLVHR